MQQVYIVSGCRTAIGDFGGAFKTQSAVDLGAAVIKEALLRAGDFPWEMVDDVILGCCIQKQNELTVGRLASLKAGLPFSTPGTTIQRNCVSAMQAVVYGIYTIMAGDADIIVAGGTEAMSDAPYFIDGARWGLRLQSTELQDGVFKALTDAYSGLIMGMTAENVAAKWNIYMRKIVLMRMSRNDYGWDLNERLGVCSKYKIFAKDIDEQISADAQ